jgi:hypothetical protein
MAPDGRPPVPGIAVVAAVPGGQIAGRARFYKPRGRRTIRRPGDGAGYPIGLSDRHETGMSAAAVGLAATSAAHGMPNDVPPRLSQAPDRRSPRPAS